jgi:hypothetical protein
MAVLVVNITEISKIECHLILSFDKSVYEFAKSALHKRTGIEKRSCGLAVLALEEYSFHTEKCNETICTAFFIFFNKRAFKG